MSGNKVLASNEKVTVLSNPTLPVSTVSSLVTNDSTTDGHDILSLNLEGFEDKNPFSGFSEEHLSKLDEFLSSEEAKKILKETSEDDFSPAMAGMDDTEVGGLGSEAANSGGDSLMFDNESKSGTEVTHVASAFSDHAYAMPVDKAPKGQSGSSTVKQSPVTFTMTAIAPPGVTAAGTQTVVVPSMPASSTVKSPATKAGSSNQVTKVAITLATASPSASPRKSTRIALRKGVLTAKEEDQEMTEEVKQEETTQEDSEQGDSGKNTGTPKGKERGKAKKEVTEDKPSPTPSRRSTRIGEIEQRELAEKIRQENLQKEKEEMESMKTVGKKEKDETPAETVVEKKGKKRGPKKKEQATETKEEEMEEQEEPEEEEEEEEETETKSPKKNKKQKAKGKKTQKGKKKNKKPGKQAAEEESENEEDDEEEDEEDKGDEDDESDDEEDKPLKPGKKGLKKGVKGKLKSVKKGLKRKAQDEEDDEDDEADDEESSPKKAKLKKGKGKQKGVGNKAKKTKIKKKGGKGKNKLEEESDESEEDEEEEEKATPKKKGKGKNKKEENDEESEEEEETPKKKGKQKGKKAKVTEEQETKESPKGKKKGKLAVKNEKALEQDESPNKKGKLKGKKGNKVKEEQVETKGKILKKGKAAKETDMETEENDDESPKNKKKKGKATPDSPKKRKLNKEEPESSEQEETPIKKKKKLVKEEAENESADKSGVKSTKLKKKGENDSEKVDSDSDGTPLKAGTPKLKKKKLVNVSKSSDSDDDKPLIVNKAKLKSEKEKGAESSEVKKETTGSEKLSGSDSKKEILGKKKTNVIVDKKDNTSENDIMKGKVKQKKKEETSVLGDTKIKQESVTESVEIKSENSESDVKQVIKKENHVRKDSKEGKNEKDQNHKDGDHKHHHHKRRDSKESNGHDSKRRDSLGSDHGHDKKRRDSLGSDHGHIKKRHDSLGSDHGHERKRHDSLGSDQGHNKKRHDSLGSDHGHDKSVKNSDSKERSKSTEDPDDKSAEHISSARRKSRKSEDAVVVDPTVIDLFKPDDVVLHHEGAEIDKRERRARKKRKTFGQDFEEGSVDGEESGGEVPDFEDDENDSDWDPPDVLYCICKQPHGNRFMIGCDKCENWYHGTCVGISRARGREMEKNNEEYTCPVCAEKGKKEETATINEKGDNLKHEGTKEKAQKIKSESHEKHRKSSDGSVFDKLKHSGSEKTHSHLVKGQSSSDSDKSLTKSSSQEKMKIPHKSSKTDHKDDKKGSEKSSSSDKDGKPLLGSIHASKSTPDDKKKRFKSLKEKHSSLPCIGPGCKEHARVGSVYCSKDCITKHTKESLKIIHRQQEKQVTKSPKGDSSEKKIVVLEKKTGRIITGPTAPMESNLISWLEEHPTFEVLCPKPAPSMSKHGKDKGKERSSSSSSSSKDRHRHHKDHHKDKGSKEEEKKEVKKEEGPDPVRLNVRKSLRDALARRSEDADDVMLSSSEMKKIALTIEEELFKLFKETGHKYKSRYRSLIFNIKDTKNKGLFRKILKRNIKPFDLVRMNPEELASKELARWREEEAKHTLELIETTEKEHMKEHLHIRKKTHKGEIEIEEDDLSTMEDKEKVPKFQHSAPDPEHKGDILNEFIADTTDQHKNHLFDLNCKICTGKVAPPVEETPIKKGAVTNTEAPKKKEVRIQEKKSEEEQLKAEEVVKEVLKAIKKAKEEQQAMASATVDSTVTVRSPDSALQSGLEKKPKFTPSGPQLWKGFVFMQDVAKFVTTAYKVSGPAEKLDLPDTVHICGRIAPDLVFDYVEKMKKIGSKEICILRFIPGNAEEKTAYINMYSYLNSRSRCGVVGNHAKHIKDFYILPLASHSKIPSVLKPFDGPGLEENRPHMLLALIIKQKSKRHNSDKSDGSSSSSHSKHEPYDPTEVKKPKLSASKSKTSSSSASSTSSTASTSSSSSKTHTPPTSKPVDKHMRPPSFYNPISSKHSSKKDKGKTEEKRLSPSSMICATNISSSDAQFPPEPVPEDPIVQVYGEDDETTAGGSPYSPSKAAEKETNDAPYDPEDDELYAGKKMKPSKPATASGSKTTAASSSLMSKVPKSLNISQTIDHIARTSNPAEATAMMVAALASANNIKDKQRLLKELTDKVEMKKKLLAIAKEKAAEKNIKVPGVGTLSSPPVTPTSKSIVTSGSTPSKGSKSVSFSTTVNVSESKTTPIKVTSPATSVSSAISSVQTSSSVSVTSSSQSGTTKPAVSTSEPKTMTTSSVKKDSVNSNKDNVPNSPSTTSSKSSNFQMPNRTDKNSSEGTEEETSKILPGSAKKKINIKINLDKSKLENTGASDKNEKDGESETKTEPESNEPRKVVSADSLPCALKSLLSSIPGSYSHFSNIRDTSQKEVEEKPKGEEAEIIPFVDEDSAEDKNTLEGGVHVDVGTNEKKPKTKKKKEKDKSKTGKGFNLSLLAFDYGESDSEGEGGGKIVEYESESESESEGHVSEEEIIPEKPIAPLPKGVFGALAPPPLPEGEAPAPPETPPMPPPLPPDEPPPLPDTPEEEEKKSKKVKPPPEIVLQAMDPVGAAILEATYKKIQKDMTVPAPPMPPLQMLSSAPVMPPVHPPTIPQPGILPTPISSVPPTVPQIGMPGIPESSMPIVPPSGVPHVAQSVMPMMQQSGVPRLPKGGMPPMAQRNMPPSGSSPQGPGQDMPPKGKLGSRGRGFRPGPRSKKIPSLFDVEVKPSKTFGFVDETEDEFPSLDQDLRQAKDLDLRKLDVDERQMAWQKAINPQFHTVWPEDIDHRHGDVDHRHGKNPIMPDSLQEETSLPPLPMDLHVQDSDFRQYSALQEDSDMRRVTHKRETKKHDPGENLDVDLRIQPGAVRSFGDDEHSVNYSSAINPNPSNYGGGEDQGPKRDNLKNPVKPLLPPHLMSAPDIPTGSPKLQSSPFSSTDETESNIKDIDARRKDSIPPPPLPPTMGFSNVNKTPLLPTPPSTVGSGVSPPVQGAPSTRGSNSGGHPPRMQPRSQPAPPGVDDWD